MNKSDTIGELTKALAKAQACIKGALTDSENPFFKSKYADLSSVWDACRKPLTDNGLAVIQTSSFLPDHPEMVVIETTLSHSSGEFVAGILVAKPIKPDPQSIGSCITYLRRYSLAAICGVSPEDDDGNAATGKEDPKQKKSEVKKTEHKLPNNVGEDIPDKLGDPPLDGKSLTLTPNMPLKKRIEVLITESGINRDLFKEWLYAKGHIELKDEKASLSTMKVEFAEKLVENWEPSVKAFNKWRAVPREEG